MFAFGKACSILFDCLEPNIEEEKNSLFILFYFKHTHTKYHKKLTFIRSLEWTLWNKILEALVIMI